MTFLKNKPLLAIIAVGVAVALTGVVFSAQVFAHGQESFEGSGYILQVLDGQAGETADADEGQEAQEAAAPLVTPAAFEADGSYRYRFPDTVQFTDAEGAKTTVSQNSFIHYDDGSVASFVKTVFVDLDHVGDAVVYYYDLPARRSLEFKGGSWRLDNGGSELAFSHVLLKLDDSHYLVLSDDITFSVNGATQMNFQGAGSYLEVEYIEGGIVRFSNDQGSYQTIASDATVTVGNGVSVNFGDKLVSTEDGAKLSLDQMVIDADDNIEISPEAQEALAGGSGDEASDAEGAEGAVGGIAGGGSASASGGAGGSSSSSSGAIAGGAADTSTSGDVVEDGGTVLEDNEDSRKTPSFSLSEGSTSPVGFTANISIADEENMLSSGTTVTIVDRLTGKVVYESNVAAGVLDFDISAAGLDPDTEYVISATATYKDGDQEYTKSFLDKVFKTDPVGIHLNKTYAAFDELSVNVSIGAYANVVNSKLRLVDSKGNVVETKDVDVTTARMDGGVDVVFENLSSNSDYTAELRDVTYSNVTVESFGDGLALKTLRKAPGLPNPESTTDRKARQFYLELPKSQIVDPDEGITGYTWEVYKAADVDLKGTGEALIKGDPVWTGNPVAGTSATVSIDELAIRTGETYVARVLVSFDDNEKVITYDTAFTQTFSISGRKFPTIRLEDDNVTFERYQGRLSIDDAGAIMWDTTHPIKIVYRDSVGYESAVLTFGPEDASEGSIATGSVTIPLDLINLRSNTEYTVQVFATYDLNDDAMDNAGEPVTGFIGSAKFTTPLPDTLAVNYENDTTSQSAFSVKVNLKAADSAHDVDLEMSTMSKIKFTLFEGSRETGTEIASRTMTGGTSVDDPYKSELKAALYQSTATITPSFFDLSDSSIKANTQYTLVVGPAEDYTSNPDPSGSGKNVANDLPIDQQTVSYPITTANTWPELPEDLTSAVQVTPITNGQAKSYGHDVDESLDAGTVVGFRVSSSFPNGNKVARKVTYYAIDTVTGSISKPALTYSQEVGTNGEIPVWTVFFDETEGKLSRGHRYRFSYTMDISITNDGTIITYPECAQKDVELTSKQQNAPYQQAEFSLYPSSRGDAKVSWTYTAKDPDGVLDQSRDGYERAEFRYAQGTASSTSGLKLEGDCTKDWKTVQVPYKPNSTYTLFVKQNLYDYNFQGDQQTTQLVRQYVDRMRDWSMEGANAAFSGLTATVDSGHGVLDVRLTASSGLTPTDMYAIAGLELTFEAADGATKTLKVAPLVTPGDTGGGTVEAEVKLKDIVDFLGRDFTVSAKVIYDNGSFGLTPEKVDSYTGFAFQQLVSDAGAAGDYVKVPTNASYSYTSSTSLSGGGNSLTGSMPVLSHANAFTGDWGNAADIVFEPLSETGATSKAKVRSSSQGLILLDSSGASTGRSVVTKWLSTTSDASPAPHRASTPSRPSSRRASSPPASTAPRCPCPWSSWAWRPKTAPSSLSLGRRSETAGRKSILTRTGT